MLEHLPAWLGHLLRGMRAGGDKVVIADPAFAAVTAQLDLTSPAFISGGSMPQRHTQDGDGISPALTWTGTPVGTASLVLIVEDAGSPTPEPLVHALAYDIDPATASLGEGVLNEEGGAFRMGRNSFGKTAWLPPDPPPGHGAHDYVFQLFALSTRPDPGDDVGRTVLVDAMKGNVIARGVLVGRYGRD